MNTNEQKGISDDGLLQVNATVFATAWSKDNHIRIGELLGYPPCCYNFFQRKSIDEKFLDTTWDMALNTIESIPTHDIIEVKGDPIANVLWRAIGLRLVPHLPCSFDCIPTCEFGINMINVGRSLGFAAEINWLKQILTWPIE